MSNFSDFPPANPYQASANAPGMAAPQRKPLPVFCMVMFILDLVFLAMRALLVVFGIIGLSMASNDPMVTQTGIFEIASGAIMLLGIPADIAMLMRQKWGALLAWVKVAGTLGSVAVGAWQLSFLADRLPPGPAVPIAMASAGIGILIRLVLIGLYVYAVILFVKSVDDAPAKQY